MMRSRLLAGILAFLCLGAVAAARSIEGPTLAEFKALERRVAALEEAVFSAPEPDPSPTHSRHPSPEPSLVAPSPEPPSEFDRVLSGRIAGATVPAGKTWKIEGVVTSSANVIVRGRLVMRAGSTLRFVGVNEAAFVGGGMDPVASDIGLWVMGDGVLDAQGTPKVPWNRTGIDPTWKASNELIVTPTAAGEWNPEHFRPFTIGSPVPSAFGFSAEVLNLSRDVVIKGTPTGRAHIFIRSTQPQTIRYATLRHLGPRKNGQKILGRWPLHFHMAGEGSRGSLVEGVVCRNAGSHCFVAHASNGVTFRGDIAYDVTEDAFWWDNNGPADHSNNITWENNVAALVRGDHSRLTAFNLDSSGSGNIARGNVAVGVCCGSDASGFGWPGHGPGFWHRFAGNVAHNNSGNGIYFWIEARFPIDRFTAYRNGQYGIDHGPYSNCMVYQDSALVGNAWGSVLLHALSRCSGEEQIVFDRLDYGGGWISSTTHNLPAITPVLFRDCRNLAGVRIDDGTVEPSTIDFVRCGLEPANFHIVHLQPGARIRVQRVNGRAYEITPAGVSTIAAFA